MTQCGDVQKVHSSEASDKESDGTGAKGRARWNKSRKKSGPRNNNNDDIQKSGNKQFRVNTAAVYVSKDLMDGDRRGFKAAGVIFYRVLPDGNVTLLLGLELRPFEHGQVLNILGGKRDEHEDSPLQTASREFCEECGGIADCSYVQRLIDDDSAVQVWYGPGKYVLYLADCPRSMFEIDDKYNRKPAHERGPYAEMSHLVWVSWSQLRREGEFGFALPSVSRHKKFKMSQFLSGIVQSEAIAEIFTQLAYSSTAGGSGSAGGSGDSCVQKVEGGDTKGGGGSGSGNDGAVEDIIRGDARGDVRRDDAAIGISGVDSGGRGRGSGHSNRLNVRNEGSDSAWRKSHKDSDAQDERWQKPNASALPTIFEMDFDTRMDSIMEKVSLLPATHALDNSIN